MNKKGVTATGWTEGIIFSLLFVIIFGGVIANLNRDYGQDNQLMLGGGSNLTDLAGNYSGRFGNYHDTSAEQIEGGEVEFTSEGLTLKSTWGLIKGVVQLLWDIIAGGWIRSLVLMMKMPVIIADLFQILYILSLVFVIVKIFMKVKP